MSKFTLRLHHASGTDPVDEALANVDDEFEARELARMRLLLTRDYSHVELHSLGTPVETFARDSEA
ncbi:hypothetical protein GCM10009422_03490 [Brevundimonas kwangchunensis]|uniref:Uncharacterized protein n=1 Tax=Brevundimonas kwangchunensis TaxID=322163 RepID=A0ABP3RK08_9CAUL